MDAIVHRPGEGERHPAGAAEILIKATGADTDGSFFLSERTIEPGFPGPPAHVHERLHDMFYVLDGELSVRLGFLNFNTPAGWEQYMRELGEAAKAGPLTREAIGAVAARHDFRAV